MDNKVYYIGEGHSLEEVRRVKDENYRCVIMHDNNATNVVLHSTCFNSKEAAIKKVFEDLKYEVEQYEYDLEHAQDGLSMAKDNLKNFKEKYNL